ncbi:phosphate uptake regulator PhoU [Amycolatopsis sp. lyj-23]|uniref:phosphate uptake regulator PhoU n=1 Tax=Amycolatopsis sp. lyj-23 TaxID=2789283 RepID=UPI00397DEF02
MAAPGAACEDQACALPALHTPREADVEVVVAAVHTAADLTRMGGLAREVASARRPVPAEVRAALERLGGQAVATARALRALLVGGDGAALGDAVALAEAAGREVREWASGGEWARGAGVAVDVALRGAVYGRFVALAGRIGWRAAGFAAVGSWRPGCVGRVGSLVGCRSALGGSGRGRRWAAGLGG